MIGVMSRAIRIDAWDGACPECGTREMYREPGFVCEGCGRHYSTRGDAADCEASHEREAR